MPISSICVSLVSFCDTFNLCLFETFDSLIIIDCLCTFLIYVVHEFVGKTKTKIVFDSPTKTMVAMYNHLCTEWVTRLISYLKHGQLFYRF